MDGHHGDHIFFIYRTLIIVIRYPFTYNIISYENPTWYHSRTGLNSLTGGPGKIREISAGEKKSMG
jgi:hypothetical protein